MKWKEISSFYTCESSSWTVAVSKKNNILRMATLTLNGRPGRLVTDALHSMGWVSGWRLFNQSIALTPPIAGNQWQVTRETYKSDKWEGTESEQMRQWAQNRNRQQKKWMWLRKRRRKLRWKWKGRITGSSDTHGVSHSTTIAPWTWASYFTLSYPLLPNENLLHHLCPFQLRLHGHRVWPLSLVNVVNFNGYD